MEFVLTRSQGPFLFPQKKKWSFPPEGLRPAADSRTPAGQAPPGGTPPPGGQPPQEEGGPPHSPSRMGLPAFRAATPAWIRPAASWGLTFTCSPETMSFTEQSPAAISSSPRKIT